MARPKGTRGKEFTARGIATLYIKVALEEYTQENRGVSRGVRNNTFHLSHQVISS